MDRHRNGEPNVKRVKQRAEDDYLVLGIKHRQAERHGKRHCSVSRRPPPKDAAFEKTQLKAMAGVYQRRDVHRRRSKSSVKWRRAASGYCLVARSYQIREEGCLSQSPRGRNEAPVLRGQSGDQKRQRPQDRHPHSEAKGRTGQHREFRGPRSPIISPIAAGGDDRYRQANGRGVPQKVTTTEDRDDIPRKPIKKLTHNAHHSVVVAGRTKLKELSPAQA